MAARQFASVGALLLSASEAIRKRKRYVAGVPIHNSHLAFDDSRWGESLLEEMTRGKVAATEDWIVIMKDGVRDDELVEICEAHEKCNTHGSADGVPFFEITATKDELDAVLEKYADKVKFAEPGMPLSVEPTLESVQADDIPWGLKRIRSRSLADQPSTDLGAADGGAGVHVYVLDTGVRVTHEEFEGRAIPTVQVGGFLGMFVEECNGDNSCAADQQSHGTHCSGTVAGKTYGVAKGATIHAVKVLGDNGAGSTFGITAAIDWVGKNSLKPAVASMSLGGRKSFVLNFAVNTMVDRGVIVVTASGNSNSDACGFSPSSAAKVINVGSTDIDDSRSSFSNFGKCLDIWAPGRDVLSSIHTSDTGAKAYSGTSMACPHVSGAAAIMLAMNPELTPVEVKANLVAAATPDVVTDAQDGSPNVLLYTRAEGARKKSKGSKKSKGGKKGKGGKKSR